jgi:hypothetical protein
MPYTVQPFNLASAFGAGQEIKQRRQQMAEAESRLATEKQHIEVADQIEKQRQQIAAQTAARQFSARNRVTAKVQAGWDLGKAYLSEPDLWPTATGLGPFATSVEKANTPVPPPAPLYDSKGNIIGYSGAHTHFIPAPRQAPAAKAGAAGYTTESIRYPGTKSTEGLPAIPGKPASSHMFGLWNTPAQPGIPAVPGVPGQPERTVTQRIPIAQQGGDQTNQDEDEYTYPAPPGATNAMPDKSFKVGSFTVTPIQ